MVISLFLLAVLEVIGVVNPNAVGDDLAAVANNSQELADLYQQVIDQYSLTFIDVDIQANFTLVDKIAEALALGNFTVQGPN